MRRIVYDTDYLVMGLGDVYLGAPCAVPLDPPHRLLTSKYNPARTYTAEGTVGIGRVCLCIYGMDSPGGYQRVGRTLPIWNRSAGNPAFEADSPWLLRFFDQVRFYPVTEAELERLREEFRAGRAEIRIEPAEFDYAAYRRFLADNAADIEDFRQRQASAFQTEVARWQAEDIVPVAETAPAAVQRIELAAGQTLLEADLSGNVWKIPAQAGQQVDAGDTLVIVEAMKMEVHIVAPTPGVVLDVVCKEGRPVNSGDPLLILTQLE